MSLILYGASLSPFVRKVRVCLLEKKLDYTMELILPRNQPDWYFAMFTDEAKMLARLS